MDGSHGSLARRVQVRYETRGYGLALAIVDDLDGRDRGPTRVGETDSDDSGWVPAGSGLELNDGVLTVGDSGITTLELRRGDGPPSVLVWDAAEVDWDSLRAG